MSEHTKEPWSIEEGDSVVHLVSEYGRIGSISTAAYWQRFNDVDGANAARIVAAVNFAAGFPTEALNGSSLAEVVAAARGLLNVGNFSTHEQQYAANALADLIDRLQPKP